MTKRLKYSKEFKLDAVSLVMEQGYERKTAAESLGIKYEMPCRWIKETNEGDGQVFRGQGKLTKSKQRYVV